MLRIFPLCFLGNDRKQGERTGQNEGGRKGQNGKEDCLDCKSFFALAFHCWFRDRWYQIVHLITLMWWCEVECVSSAMLGQLCGFGRECRLCRGLVKRPQATSPKMASGVPRSCSRKKDRGLAKGGRQKGVSQKKSEQIGANRGIPENKKSKSEQKTYRYYQEPRKGGFSKGGFCRVKCHAQGDKKYLGLLGPAVRLGLLLGIGLLSASKKAKLTFPLFCCWCPGALGLHPGASGCALELACASWPWTFAWICWPHLPYHPQRKGEFQRPLTLILPQKYRDTNGSRIVIQIGGVYTTFCEEEGILLQEYRDRNGRCIAILFKSIGVRDRFDSPDQRKGTHKTERGRALQPPRPSTEPRNRKSGKCHF